jgi:hypothetical protein
MASSNLPDWIKSDPQTKRGNLQAPASDMEVMRTEAMAAALKGQSRVGAGRTRNRKRV